MTPVFFVGAGPGDPELITVKGQRLLAEAGLIVYTGSLINPELFAGVKGELVSSASLSLEEIVGTMARGWREGKRVVRLHTGDPAIFGAVREQMERLDELGIPCEMVPGVSSTAAAAAALKAELTLPEVSQTVIITRRGGRTPVPAKEDLTVLAAHQATMLILLSVAMIDEVAAELQQGGYPAATPCAVVEKASWPEERVVVGTLADIAGRVRAAGIRKTAIIAVGEVLGKAPLAAVSKLYDRAFSHGCRTGRQTAPGEES